MVFNVTGDGDGYLNKQHHGVINECITNADRYNFEFPSSRPDDMAIYLASIVFADMLWYEENYCGLSYKIWTDPAASLPLIYKSKQHKSLNSNWLLLCNDTYLT